MRLPRRYELSAHFGLQKAMELQQHNVKSRLHIKSQPQWALGLVIGTRISRSGVAIGPWVGMHVYRSLMRKKK